jgi:hypothetical protein
MRLEILAGSEPQAFELSNVSIKSGSAEVGYRRFENGLVLMNGSAAEKATFDLASIAPGSAWGRIDGVVDPAWNNGQKESTEVTLPPREALFLEKR